MSKFFQLMHGFFFVYLPFVTLVLLSAQLMQIRQLSTPVSKLSQSAASRILEPIPVPVATPATAPAPPPPSAPKPSSSVSKAVKAAPAAAPTTDIASASICPNQDQITQTNAVLLCMTSYARKFHGLGAVSSNAQLTEAAAAKANDIVSCDDFSHTACGRPSNYWISAKGYQGNCSAENIAQGQKSPGQVFIAWMNSTGHRENILRSSYIHLGVAVQDGPKGAVWVMELGGC